MDNVQLLQRYRAGDEGAFREIVHQYKDDVYTFLRRFLSDRNLVDDVFQETFLQLHVSRNRFDPSRPLRLWLFTIAANKVKNVLRHRQRIKATSIENMFDNGGNSINNVLCPVSHDDHMPLGDLIRNETEGEVKQAIARMPARLCEILILAYFEKFSYAQMAGILQIPMGTVKSRLHRAVRRFAEDWNAVTPSETPMC
jgi:RNA polymerase sigma-70 factor (ECF subfamily)